MRLLEIMRNSLNITFITHIAIICSNNFSIEMRYVLNGRIEVCMAVPVFSVKEKEKNGKT